MKKQIITGFLAASIILGGCLSSCTKDRSTTLLKLEQLEVNASISRDLKTKKAITGNEFPEGSEIGIQLLNLADNTPYDPKGLTNHRYVSDSRGKWTSSEEYILTANKAKVYAYYPYRTLSDNIGAFSSVPISIPPTAVLYTETDYMYATPVENEAEAVSNTNSTINLQMNNALVQVSFILYKENYPGAGKLVEFSIEDEGATNHILTDKREDNDLAMKLSDGSVTGGAKGKITRILPTPVFIEASTVNPDFPSPDTQELKNQVMTKGVYTILAPTGSIKPGEIRFGFNIDNTNYYVTNEASMVWEQGMQYIYKIKLSGTAVNIEGVSVTEWLTIIGDEINI